MPDVNYTVAQHTVNGHVLYSRQSDAGDGNLRGLYAIEGTNP